MMKQSFSTIARLVVLALLLTPAVPTAWASDSYYTLTQQASTQEKKGELSNAEWYYRKAIGVNPDYAPAYAGLGDVLMKRGDYRNAEQAFKTCQNKAAAKDSKYSQYRQYCENHSNEAENSNVVSATEILAALSPGKGIAPLHKSINMRFSSNSDQVTEQMETQLREMARGINEVLKTNENSKVLIQGHTDNEGSDTENRALSQRRAQNVRIALIMKFQMPADRLETAGQGEKNPVALQSNEDEPGLARFKNQRITLVRMDR